MRKLTPAQFTLYAAALTAGFALLLPNMAWLTFLACNVLFWTANAARRGRDARAGWGVLFLVLAVAFVAIRGFSRRSGWEAHPPPLAEWLTITVGWLAVLGTEHRAWRRSRVPRPAL